MAETHVLRTEPRLTSEVSSARNSPGTQRVTRNLPKTATLDELTGAANQARVGPGLNLPKTVAAGGEGCSFRSQAPVRRREPRLRIVSG